MNHKKDGDMMLTNVTTQERDEKKKKKGRGNRIEKL